MSSLGEHLHHGVLGVLVDRVVAEALPEVLLDHLVLVGFWSLRPNGMKYLVSHVMNKEKEREDTPQTLLLVLLLVLLQVLSVYCGREARRWRTSGISHACLCFQRPGREQENVRRAVAIKPRLGRSNLSCRVAHHNRRRGFLLSLLSSVHDDLVS